MLNGVDKEPVRCHVAISVHMATGRAHPVMALRDLSSLLAICAELIDLEEFRGYCIKVIASTIDKAGSLGEERRDVATFVSIPPIPVSMNEH